MNPFRDAITKTRVAATSQGVGDKYGLVWLALSVAADLQDANPVASTYADACQEVLFRWQKYKGFGYQRVSELLAPLVGR